jgi:hypothetical protein
MVIISKVKEVKEVITNKRKTCKDRIDHNNNSINKEENFQSDSL